MSLTGQLGHAMGRAFSPDGFSAPYFRGVALGWYKATPSALINRHASGAPSLQLLQLGDAVALGDAFVGLVQLLGVEDDFLNGASFVELEDVKAILRVFEC